MEWLVIYGESFHDIDVSYYATKEEALDGVRRWLTSGNHSLEEIKVFEAKRKKIVIDIEGETAQ